MVESLDGANPLVSIVMPALNEAHYISRAVASIVPRSVHFPCEVIVVDGGSQDATCEIIKEMAATDPRIRLLKNKRRIQAAGVNLGARRAAPGARYLLRADCHAQYPEGFVEQCVRTLIAVRAASVVVPMWAEGN